MCWCRDLEPMGTHAQAHTSMKSICIFLPCQQCLRTSHLVLIWKWMKVCDKMWTVIWFEMLFPPISLKIKRILQRLCQTVWIKKKKTMTWSTGNQLRRAFSQNGKTELLAVFQTGSKAKAEPAHWHTYCEVKINWSRVFIQYWQKFGIHFFFYWLLGAQSRQPLFQSENTWKVYFLLLTIF